MIRIIKKKRKEITFYLFFVLFFITLKTLEKTAKIPTPEIYNFALKLDAGSISAGVNKQDNDDTRFRAKLINRPSIPKTLTNCTSRSPALKIETRGNFTIVTNFVVAKRQVNCRQFVTYTTHGDFRYLDNLVPLIKRWLAPISVALYTPSSELLPTLNRIAFLRECTTPLIKTWVTFHLFSETMEFKDPTPFLTHLQESSDKKSGICEDKTNFTGNLKLVGQNRNRVYPINVARNVARLAATTHYILASDIELFPSLNFNRKFIDLLTRQKLMFKSRQVPYVFVLPVFEINNLTKLPDTKRELVSLVNNGSAISFHAKYCRRCHVIPKYKKWIKNEGNDSINVFHVAKRGNSFLFWEPIFVGTNQDPLYEERLSYEGRQDKMIQAYALCLLDYDFMILDNAFLVHRGIEHLAKFRLRDFKWRYTNEKVSRQIRNKLERLYGNRISCDPRRRNRTIAAAHNNNKKLNDNSTATVPKKTSRGKVLKKQGSKKKSTH